jgi:hypothetical protein
MKKILLAAILLVSMAINAQVEYLPFENVKHIAFENARSLWGDVYADEPIPLYSINGDLIAYTFNFSIGQPFPSRQTLIERCNSPADSEEKTDRWLIGQFANMLVSAGSNMTPILKYSGAISDDYAYGARIEELAFEKLQSENCTLEKVIFMSDMAKWFVYSDRDGNRAYVKVFPPVEVYNELEFNEAVKQRYTKAGLWVIPEDNENLWTSFLNGKLLNGKSTTLIPDEEFVPYYDWSYGCTPTAFSMALAYWDNRGMISANDYGNLVKHHFQRYDHVQGETDKNVSDLQKALAIAMSTDSMTGSTGSCCWLSGYIAETDARGYSFTGTDKYGTSAQYLGWAQTEIDAGRPYHMGTPGHSNTGVGYTSDNYLIRHDTWQPSHSSVYYTSCDLVGTIVPGGQYGAAVNITSPFGDPRYSDHVVPPSQGEHLYAGDRFEITWDYDTYSGSYARLLYSTNGGYNWTVISSNTPNDGMFDWSIPSGLSNSSLGRVKVEVRDGGTTAVQAADGSYGNFDIHSGGSLPSLSEDISTVTSTDPDYYQFENNPSYWGVVGLRTTNGTDDWDIELHSGIAFNDVIAVSTDGGSTVDFVVIDGNHTSSSDRGIKARRYAGTSTARVEFEGGSDIISAGTALNTNWPANDVVEIYDVYLNPGIYGFILDVTSGTANLDFALYGSDGIAYYAPRSAYKAISTSGGAGGDEYFTFSATTADWYGLCLWANDANSANYTIRVEPAGTWTGLVSTNWNNANNWSGNIIPDATINVTIPSGTPYQPYIYTAIANCNSVTINTGATLTVGGYALNVAGNLTTNGTLASNNASGEINVQGDVFWNSGSIANFTTTAPFKVYGNWNFESGSNANLANGTVLFMGNADKYISSYSSTSSFNNVGSYKTGGYKMGVSYFSSQPLSINGDIYVHPGAIFGIYSTHEVILKGDVNSNGTFLCNYGKVILDGVNQNLKMNTGDYFNSLTFSQSGTVTISNILSSVLDVNGNLEIESGTFNMQDRTMKVGGNWTNSAGSANFIEGTGRVIFDGGNYHQYCSTETFNILEVYKPDGGAFRVDGGMVSCAQYDWTAGAVDVLSGTFTANDLADNGLYGAYYVNPGGEINLTNSGTGTWIDLIGEIYNYGGVINLTGSEAYWPYSNNANLTMTSGVIDFKTCGIHIPSGYTWTHNITGGTIKTSGYLSGNCSSFTPTEGTFEFYGSGDATISQSNGCTLRNVKINKGTAREGDYVFEGPLFDQRSGVELLGGGKSNTITLNSDFTITGNLDIDEGTFSLGNYKCDVAGTVNIYGTLAMNNAVNDLSSNAVYWYSGSNDLITAGTFHANYWSFNEGTNASLSTGNTAYISSSIGNTDIDAEFGNLVAGPWAKGTSEIKASYPLKVAGNYTLATGADWMTSIDNIVGGVFTVQSGADYEVINGADITIGGSCIISGTLTLFSGCVVTSAGELTFPSTGILNVGPGTFTNNFGTGSVSLAGTLMLTTGIVEFPNRSVSLSSTFNDQISGGVFRVGKTLSANTAGTFQPMAGTVEFINPSAGNYVQVTNGNYFYNMVLDKPGSSFLVYDNLTIKGSLFIDDGVLNSNNKTISIGENWYNNVGSSAFNETNSRVIFNGNAAQFCSTEDFYILEVNKPMELLYNLSGHSITCQIYDWTSGGIWISPGNFTAFDLAANGLFGTFAIYSGVMNLYQDSSQLVDINGTVLIGSGGELNVFGGATTSYWSWASNASVAMTGGTLDFKDVGIQVYNSMSYSFTENISDGKIRTSGLMYVTNPNFTPTGGTVELYGDADAGIVMTAGNFHNLKINKAGGDGLKAQPVLERDGTIIEGTRANTVNVTTNLLVNNDLTVETGSVNVMGVSVSAGGNVNVNSGGVLVLNSSSNLLMASGKTLSINDGGTINALGSMGAETRISRISTGNYGFAIENGGTIAAEYGIFEYMDTNGVNVKSGATVDPVKSFTNCNIRNGQSGGRLLTLNSNQSLLLNNVVFPGSTGNYNVSKTTNAGVVVLSDYSGMFAGPTYEQDTYGRIHWSGEISPNVSLDGVLIGSGQDLCFEALQTITLGGSQSFIVENGGNVNLVAGQNIRLLEGTHVQNGAYLHAWITTDGIYCGSGSSMLAAVEENSVKVSNLEKSNGQSGFRIYPNPTRGIFTLEMDELMEFSSINVGIYNVVGEKILSYELPEFTQYKFDLTDQQPGVFLIRVLRGNEVGIGKVIKQ